MLDDQGLEQNDFEEELPVIRSEKSLPTVPRTLDAERLVRIFLSNKSERTIAAYKRDLSDFAKFLGIQAGDLDEAARFFFSRARGEANALAAEYREDLEKRKLSPATINRRLSALRSMVEQAGTLGLINWELKIKGPKTKAYRDTKGPGKTGFVRLKAEVEKRDDPKGKRDLLLLHLLYDIALRRSEVCALSFPEDVIWENGNPESIRILGKGRSEKEILTLPKRTRQYLADWIRVRGDWEGPLFINFHHDGSIRGKRLTPDGLYYVIKELGRRTDQKVRPHGLRHTSISEAVRRSQAVGMDVTKVLKFSRHRNLNTLQAYIDAEEGAQAEIAELVAMD